MTSKRNLGPPLAYAGLGVVIVAVIAGLVAVGGPGDARDRRLDDMTLTRISSVAAAAQCAFILEGAAPLDDAGISAAIGRAAQRSAASDPGCGFYDTTPIADDIEYSRLADDRVRVCGDFRRPFDPKEKPPQIYRGNQTGFFPELSQPHPAGRHCYEIQLVKPLPRPAS